MQVKQSHTYCPYCKEAIKPGAVKCRHCGSMIGGADGSAGQSEPETFIRNALKGKYEIIGLLGKGGMASVYRARQLSVGRIVALKVIHPNLLHDEEFVRRFLQEARVCSSLSHHNIIRIYDFGETGGLYYMSMELLEGQDLSELIARRKRLNAKEVLGYTAPVAHALLYIHQKGYMHRDVKSSNIFICKDGRPVLMDFGIAYAENLKPLTIAGTILGTPQFLSPEQANGSKALPESDFYGLGIVMYECLTGRVPFNDSNPVMVIHKIVKENPVPPSRVFKDVPGYASDITMGLLSKEPVKRVPVINYLLKNFLGKAHKKQMDSYLTPVSRKKPAVRKNMKSGNKPVIHNDKLIRNLLKVALGVIILVISFSGVYLLVDEWQERPFEAIEESKMNGAVETLSDNETNESDASDSENTAETGDIYDPAKLAMDIIESGMVTVDGVMVMDAYVNQRLWRLVMEGNSSGNSQIISNISFNQVESFIRRLNSLPDNAYTYQLPSLELVVSGHRSGRLGVRRNEWVNDPPVFPSGTNPAFAKYYHTQFTEGGWERNRPRNDIFFRLSRQ